MEQDFSTLTVDQLKDHLRKLDLPVSGNKATLIKRINAHELGVLTGNLDADRIILLKLDDIRLEAVCLSNKYATKVCNEVFWKMKVEQEYGQNLADTKPKGITYRKHYFDLPIIYYDKKERVAHIIRLLKRTYHRSLLSSADPLYDELDEILVKVFRTLYRHKNAIWSEMEYDSNKADPASDIYEILVSGYDEDFQEDNITGKSFGIHIYDGAGYVVDEMLEKLNIIMDEYL